MSACLFYHFIRKVGAGIGGQGEKLLDRIEQKPGPTSIIQKINRAVAEAGEKVCQRLYFGGGKIVGVETRDFEGIVQQVFIIL